MSDPLHKSGLFWKLQSLLRRKEAESVRDRVEELIERGEENGKDDKSDDDLDTHERALLSNVLRLQGTTAYDVMVPRADIMAMPEDFSQATPLPSRLTRISSPTVSTTRAYHLPVSSFTG